MKLTTMTQVTVDHRPAVGGHDRPLRRLAAASGQLKAKPGGELQVHGSGALIRWLLANYLVDEMTLIIVPGLVGQGTRLFPHDGPDIALDLVESRVDSKGVTIQVYQPAGRPQYAPATVELTQSAAR
jgi:riboflavin biosynthesis pyrimidine reductase